MLFFPRKQYTEKKIKCPFFIFQLQRAPPKCIDEADETLVDDLETWEEYGIVTIELNTKDWQLIFKLDDEILAKIEVEKGKDYFPAVSVASVDESYQDFKLLVD